MKTTKYIIFSVMIISTMFLQSCADTDGRDNSAKSNKNFPSVEVMKVEGNQFTDIISVLGQVEPVEKANLSFLEGGILKSIIAKKGTRVKEGDTIAVIDNIALKAALD